MTVANATQVRYHLDAEDRLDGFDAGWTAFAHANDGEALLPSKVLGQPLWTFISDSTTILIYRKILQRLRAGGPPVAFRFRCDSPDRRRLLGMRITSDRSGGIQFDVTPISEEWRAPVLLLAANAPRDAGLVLMCAWCQHVRLPSERWVEVEEAIDGLAIFNTDTVPRVSHGICPSCSVTWLESGAF